MSRWFIYLKPDSQEKIKKLSKLNLKNLPGYSKNELIQYYNQFQKYYDDSINISINTVNKSLEKSKYKYIGNENAIKDQKLNYQTHYKYKNQEIIFYHKLNEHSYEDLLLNRIKTLLNFYNYDNKTEISIITNDKNRKLNKKKSNNIKSDLQIMKEKSIANISSGVTTSNGLLIISRIEELPKLLVHELIHLIGLDGNIFDPKSHHIRDSVNKISEYYNNHFCVNKLIRSVAIESYTESLSNILNCMFFAIEIPNGNFQIFVETFELERQYSIYQTAKLLYFFGFNTFDDFFVNCKNTINSEKRVFITDTLYLDYTIIRSIMFYSFDDIIKIMNISKNKFNISNSSPNFYDKLLKIIDNTLYQNEDYKNILNNYLSDMNNVNDLDIGYTCIDIDVSKLK